MPLQELVEDLPYVGRPQTLNLNAAVFYPELFFFSSAEWFGTEFREFAPIFAPRNGIPSCSLFHWKVWNGIPRVCSSAEWFGTKFREFAPIFAPRNGILSCFLFRGRVRNGIPRISVPRNSRIPSEITICSVNSVFRGIISLSEIPNPSWTEHNSAQN